MDVLIFARVSKDTSGRERSVDEQINDLTDWSNSEGWNIAHVVRELGSASQFSTRRTRSEWDEAIGWIESGRIQAILTWESSRATRDLTAFTQLRDVCARARVQWGYGRKLYDLTQRDDRFRTGLDALLAEDEAHRTSERLQRATHANAIAGRPHGKNIYGYRRTYDQVTRQLLAVEPDPLTAPVVQEAAQRVLAGDTLYCIAKSFNARQIPPRRAKFHTHNEEKGWTAEAVKQMLGMPAYKGVRVHRGAVIGDANWVPLIDQDDWDRIQSELNPPDRRRSDPWQIKHLLTGIARCGHQGCRFYLRAGQNTSRTASGLVRYMNYACQNHHTSVAMKYLDAIVVESILQRLSKADFVESLTSVEDENADLRAQLRADIEADHAWLELVRVRAAEDRNLDALFEQERLIKPKIEAARRQLERLSHASPRAIEISGAADVRAAWAALAPADKRDVIRTLVNVLVHPAKRRGARGVSQAIERTEIVWRH